MKHQPKQKLCILLKMHIILIDNVTPRTLLILGGLRAALFCVSRFDQSDSDVVESEFVIRFHS